LSWKARERKVKWRRRRETGYAKFHWCLVLKLPVKNGGNLFHVRNHWSSFSLGEYRKVSLGGRDVQLRGRGALRGLRQEAHHLQRPGKVNQKQHRKRQGKKSLDEGAKFLTRNQIAKVKQRRFPIFPLQAGRTALMKACLSGALSVAETLLNGDLVAADELTRAKDKVSAS